MKRTEPIYLRKLVHDCFADNSSEAARAMGMSSGTVSQALRVNDATQHVEAHAKALWLLWRNMREATAAAKEQRRSRFVVTVPPGGSERFEMALKLAGDDFSVVEI